MHITFNGNYAQSKALNEIKEKFINKQSKGNNPKIPFKASYFTLDLKFRFRTQFMLDKLQSSTAWFELFKYFSYIPRDIVNKHLVCLFSKQMTGYDVSMFSI